MSDRWQPLRDAAKKATPGPWKTDEPQQIWSDAGGDYVAITEWGDPYKRDVAADAIYIAAANPVEITGLLAERDQLLAANAALLTAAEHGLSLMVGQSYTISDEHPDGVPVGVPKLYHRCEGCEAALKILQAHGLYIDVQVASEAENERG
jgi:hypothetical protein